MTSQLNVDTIVDKAGSGGTNVKIGNTSFTVSEGGSATTNTVQGLAKAWANYDTTGTTELKDSFNMGSITDNNTGDTTFNFSNNFGNANYCFTGMGGRQGASRSTLPRFNDNVTTPTASLVRIQIIDDQGAGSDVDRTCISGHGDLA